jgi:hypothetical protein
MLRPHQLVARLGLLLSQNTLHAMPKARVPRKSLVNIPGATIEQYVKMQLIYDHKQLIEPAASQAMDATGPAETSRKPREKWTTYMPGYILWQSGIVPDDPHAFFPLHGTPYEFFQMHIKAPGVLGIDFGSDGTKVYRKDHRKLRLMLWNPGRALDTPSDTIPDAFFLGSDAPARTHYVGPGKCLESALMSR